MSHAGAMDSSTQNTASDSHPTTTAVTRRRVLAGIGLGAAAAASGITGIRPAAAAPGTARDAGRIAALIADLERRHDVRIGLSAAALTGPYRGRRLDHRADERFLMLSVFKAIAAAAVLDGRLITPDPKVLDRPVFLPPEAICEGPAWFAEQIAARRAPSVAEVCRAAIQLSDSTAANALMSLTGGPDSITRFARDNGDPVTQLTEWEPELNTPDGDRNTTSPRAIGALFAAMIVGRALRTPARRRLTDWMLGNQTSDQRFRAGLPAGWTLADKTGSGIDATANDVGIAFDPAGNAYQLAVLTSSPRPDTERVNEIFAILARESLAELSS
ncbi:class A beta-lactamase [Enemella evansiae]|nr:class A beta-lactamase [Enemella evansiae]